MKRIVPVILCGGSGSRLWPLSRQSYPKQLLALNGDKTLLQQTILRLDGLADQAPPLVICNEEHRFLVAEQLREIGVQDAEILLEPEGKNTAPAVALAALHVQEHAKDCLLLVLPADHLISDVSAFHEAVEVGRKIAHDDFLVSFGVQAGRPETAYGYIKVGEQISAEVPAARRLAGFVEKPDIARAEQMVASGSYQWNCGIYLMKPDFLQAEMSSHCANILAACQKAYSSVARDLDFLRISADLFAECPDQSIDYALLEKTSYGAVVPLNSPWSDVGSWKTLWQVGDKDQNGNVLVGDVVAHDSTNCYIHAVDRLVATVGLENQVIVETADAILVADKEQVQDVRHVVAALNREGRREINLHRRVYRPWGSYEVLALGDRFQVKLISVKPGAALSLQMHHHRAEHWIIVRGTAHVTCGEKVFMVSENESTFIPVGTKHRLENPGVIDLELIEIQSGSYLEEDDIIRF